MFDRPPNFLLKQHDDDGVAIVGLIRVLDDGRPNAGRVGDANERCWATLFLTAVVDGGTANGEKLKADVLVADNSTAAQAAEWNLILQFLFFLFLSEDV